MKQNLPLQNDIGWRGSTHLVGVLSKVGVEEATGADSIEGEDSRPVGVSTILSGGSHLDLDTTTR